MSSIPVKAKKDFTLASGVFTALGAFMPVGASIAARMAGFSVPDSLIAGAVGGGLMMGAGMVSEGRKNAFCSGAVPGTLALGAGTMVGWAGEGMVNEGLNLMTLFKGACATTLCAATAGTAAFAGAFGEKWKEKKKAIAGALAGAAGAVVLSTALTVGEEITSSPASDIYERSGKPASTWIEPVASLANRIPG